MGLMSWTLGMPECPRGEFLAWTHMSPAPGWPKSETEHHESMQSQRKCETSNLACCVG
jgi:hypothetical protein